MALPFVTETTTPVNGKWVACTESAVTMAANWSDPGIPGTVTEMRQLQAVGSHTTNGGRTQAMILSAMQTLWGHRPEAIHSYPDALTHLQGGYVLSVAGNYHNLPTILQRWDKPFGANPQAWHEVCVGPIDRGDHSVDPLVYWRDPLGRGTYVGEWVRWSVVTAFALSSGDILAFPKEGWSMLACTYTPGRMGTLTIDGKADTRGLLLSTTAAVKLPPTLRGSEGLYVTARKEDAFLASVNGAPVAVLAHNATFAPDAAPSDYLAHVSSVSGVLTISPA